MSTRDERGELVARTQEIDPYEFEHFVADVWEAEGWETSTSQQSNDQGVDVVAERSGTVDQKLVIQAKRYSDGNNVGEPAVKQYYALKEQETDADAVVVVTTSEFSKNAKIWAYEHNVKLVDGAGLADLVAKNGCKHILSEYESGKRPKHRSRSEPTPGSNDSLAGSTGDSTERPTSRTDSEASGRSSFGGIDRNRPDLVDGFSGDSTFEAETDFLEDIEAVDVGLPDPERTSRSSLDSSTDQANQDTATTQSSSTTSSSPTPTSSSTSSTSTGSDPGRLEYVTAAVLLQGVGFGITLAPSLPPGVSDSLTMLLVVLGWFGSPIAVYRDAKALHAAESESAMNRVIWPIAAFMIPVFGPGTILSPASIKERPCSPAEIDALARWVGRVMVG